MLHNRDAIRQFAVCAAVLFALCALMVGVYAVLGRFSPDVLLGAAFGYAAAAGNFLALTVVVSNAADRAEETGNAAEAQKMIQASTPIRLFALLGLYFLVLRFTTLDRIASLLPLIFMQAVIRLVGFFRKDGAGK